MCLFLSVIVSCGVIEEEPDQGRTPEEILEIEQKALLTLTGGNSPVRWKIAKAILKNSNGEFDISQNYNVKDDEFFFVGPAENPNSRAVSHFGESRVSWNERNSVNLKANSVLDAVQDYNTGIKVYNFNVLVEEEIEINVAESPIAFRMKGEKIHGTITYPQEQAKITVELVKFTETELAGNIQQLTFSKFSSIETRNMAGHSPAFIASHKNQSLYFVGREDFNVPGQQNPQRIIKFNSITGEINENRDASFGDLVTKSAAVILDKLHIFGASYYSLYDLELKSLQPWKAHGDQLTRFGMSPYRNELMVYGLSNVGQVGGLSKTIKSYILNTNTFNSLGDCVDMRTDVRGVLMDDHLFILGGSEDWLANVFDNHIVKFNLLDNSSKKIVTPISMNRTYSGYKNNLLFFMGRTPDGENNDKIVLFDKNTEQVSVINTNLKQLEPSGHVQGMTVLDGKLYVIYGAPIPGVQGPQPYKIYRADLP